MTEFRAGFIKGWICIDKLITLTSLLQINLRNPGRAVYALFLDFKSSFPSVSHEILWRKLHENINIIIEYRI